jgi:protoheme IX farnesyltransferase
LAIYRKDDYQRANVPMMPVTHGVEFTRTQVVLYTWLLLAASLLPVALGAVGGIYALSATALGVRFLQWSYRLYFQKRPEIAWNTFKYSIRYLLCLFIALLLDRFLWRLMIG